MNEKQRQQVLEWLPRAIIELRKYPVSSRTGHTISGAVSMLSDIAYAVQNRDYELVDGFAMDGTETIDELYDKMYA